MLQGHVDKISHQLVEGWAADSANPDDPVDVSIFVNGVKIAQVVCDRSREDLLQAALYGNGNHGFSYKFGDSLPAGTEARISVRFSQSGYPLVHGDCLIGDTTVRYLALADRVPEHEPVMMPAPREPRSLFELLFWYDEACGLYPLLSRLDLDDHKPQHVYYSVFGEFSEYDWKPSAAGRYYPCDHLNELLLSDEFQSDLLPRLLQAYDDKRRLIFVHIPKCLGTDLSNKLKTRYPWLDFNIMDGEWTRKDAMLRHLSRFALHIRFSDCVYLCGHGGLNYYIKNRLIRPMDQVFTIVRHPFDVIISQVNYVLTRFWLDAEKQDVRPDTAEWLALVGIESLPSSMSEEFVHYAGMKVLQNTDIVKPNSMCYWLAGNEADANTALAALISQDVEVTDADHYRAWLAQRWKIQSETRHNSSMKFMSADTLPQDLLDYIRDISLEDMKLYQAISKSIVQSGRPSVLGQELAWGMA